MKYTIPKTQNKELSRLIENFTNKEMEFVRFYFLVKGMI